MELIHADGNLIELQMLTEFDAYEAISGLGYKYSDNDFELQIPESIWLTQPITDSHYLYQLGTEWGGRVEFQSTHSCRVRRGFRVYVPGWFFISIHALV